MIRRLFTDVAAVYDRMNHLLSLGRDRVWRRRAAACATGRPERILDLACGTGDFAFALVHRFPEAEILGIDLTPAMLAIARAKNASPRLAFAEGDAQNLDASLTGFRLVSCAFGFRNFPNKAAALVSARRALAPGGELLVLEFFRPSNRLLGLFTAGWLRALAFLFARSRASAYGYLRESMKTTLTAEAFVACAEENGFRLAERRFFAPCCTCLRFAVAEDAPPVVLAADRRIVR